MTVGESICEIRKEKNMTQKDLADKIFVSPALVSKWESGVRRPDYRTAVAIAGALGVETDRIVDLRNMMTAELSKCIPDGMTAEELPGLINAFLSGLTSRETDLFVLRYYHFKSAKEIAGITGAGESSVRMSLSRVRSKLKSFLRRFYNEKQRTV